MLSARQRRLSFAGSSQGLLRRLMVVVNSRAACSQGLALAGLATVAAVSGSQRCRNIRIDAHSLATECGMPDRPCI
jgi:hypothetical protein